MLPARREAFPKPQAQKRFDEAKKAEQATGQGFGRKCSAASPEDFGCWFDGRAHGLDYRVLARL